MPPVAFRLRAYDALTVASGSGDVVVMVGFDVTASVNCLVAVTELLSETCAVNVKLPPSVGTPEIVAVPASKESPVGSPPSVMLQRYGGVPPVARVPGNSPPRSPRATQAPMRCRAPHHRETELLLALRAGCRSSTVN
jgi:hypothetical protein